MVIVKQQDARDCGPCALKSFIEYYGGYVSLEKIREHAYTDINGTSVYHLIKAAQKYGFDAIAKKYLDNQINDIQCPAIVHVRYENGQTHFMCLYKIMKDSVLLMDPAKGKVVLCKDQFIKIFTGVVIELSLKNEIIILEKESNIYNLFLNIKRKNKKLCVSVLLTSVVLAILTIFSGFYFKVIYEYIQTGGYINSIKYLIYLFLIITIFKVLFEFIRNNYENHLNKNIDISILRTFISHVFNLPLKVINKRPIGEIFSRINEISSIKEIFSQIFITCFLDLILSFGSVLLLFYINKDLALILCLTMLIYVIMSLVFNPYLYRRIRQNIDYQTENNSFLIDSLNMINSIKNLNKTSIALEKIEQKMCVLLYDNFTFANNLNVFEFFRNFFNETGVFIINTYGFYLIFTNRFSLVDLVIFNTLLSFFVDPIKKIIALIPKYNFLRASFRKICDFVDLEEEKLGVLEHFNNGDICFRNVEFSYNDYSKIIRKFNLTIKSGEKVMLKGQSGCGKSTLCQLLQRVYLPTSGFIQVGNKNILDYSLLTLRNHIIYVGQKENLYTDTISNNITFWQDDCKDFDKVCNICLINDIVDKKKFRYDFGIDNNFANISGGEKQRIILARALLRGGDILILDEALSELDFKSEEKIINNIKREYPEKTLIYISHKNHDRLFNRIITLRNNNE